MKTKNEIKIGKYDVGWISSGFYEQLPLVFEERKLGKFQTLERFMSDREVETKLTTGLCEVGDVVAFLKNPPEECKDGYSNLFYTSSCVVSVSWYAGTRKWDVDAWRRGVDEWYAGPRVFFPATDSQTLSKETLSPSDPLLEKRVEALEEQMRCIRKFLVF